MHYVQVKGKARKRRATVKQSKPEYRLPGVGDGLVDPEFDDVRGAERDAIEGVMGHERAEDYD